MSFKRYEGIDNPNDLFAQQKKKTTVPYVSVTLALIHVLVSVMAEQAQNIKQQSNKHLINFL